MASSASRAELPSIRQTAPSTSWMGNHRIQKFDTSTNVLLPQLLTKWGGSSEPATPAARWRRRRAITVTLGHCRRWAGRRVRHRHRQSSPRNLIAKATSSPSGVDLAAAGTGSSTSRMALSSTARQCLCGRQRLLTKCSNSCPPRKAASSLQEEADAASRAGADGYYHEGPQQGTGRSPGEGGD